MSQEKHVTYETEEYGGFLLMMDTVPEKSDYDYGTQLHPHRLDVHPPDRLARQAALRPRPVGRRLDRRLGDGARRGLHRPGHRHPGRDAAQRRGRRGRSIVLAVPRAPAPHRLRVLPAPRRRRPGSSSGGRSRSTTPGSWSSTTTRWSGSTTTGASPPCPTSSSCGSATGSPSRRCRQPQPRTVPPRAGPADRQPMELTSGGTHA